MQMDKPIQTREQMQNSIKKLLASSVDVNFDSKNIITCITPDIYNRYCRLFIACYNNMYQYVKSCVEDHNINVNCVIKTNLTSPLIFAAWNNNYKIIKYLIEHGANVNHVTIDNCTALHFAVKNKCIETIKLLIDAGCDIDAKHTGDVTPLFIACNSDNINIDIINLLINSGANPKYINDQTLKNPLLTIAAENNDLQLVKTLYNNYSQHIFTDFYNKDSKFYFKNIIEENYNMDIENDTDSDIDPDFNYVIKYTPIGYAIKNNNFEMFAFLIDKLEYKDFNNFIYIYKQLCSVITLTTFDVLTRYLVNKFNYQQLLELFNNTLTYIEYNIYIDTLDDLDCIFNRLIPCALRMYIIHCE